MIESMAFALASPLPDAKLAWHGGNLAAARRAFPHVREPWIDLSTGINPHAWPVGPIAAGAWHRLPEPAAIARLETVAAATHGANHPALVAAAPGTQALIQWLPWLFPARTVGILGHTYGEHARVWTDRGAKVTIVQAASALAGFDVGVVVNPNNPDGRLIEVVDLIQLSAANGMVIIDEAFMDLISPSRSLIPDLPENALVLRSFGKTYGLAGIRLGFAVAGSRFMPALRRALGPWAISGMAVDIGCEALADIQWLDETRDRLQADVARLDHLLRGAGFAVIGGTPLYRLARAADAGGWHTMLGKAGILTRPFLERPDVLRFGIPGGPDQWRRLAGALNAAGAAEL